MKITTIVEIPPRRIADLMVTAIEGGIGYWCSSVKLLTPDLPFSGPWYDNERLYEEIAPMDTPVQIEVLADNKHHIVTLAKMKQAFELMQEFGNPKGYCWDCFIMGHEDATIADVWFQLAVFGEVVYG